VDDSPVVCITVIVLNQFSEFKQKKSGHIINLGSIAGIEPYAGGSIYTATKHAVRAFTGSLLRELVNTPIRVTEIQPGKPSGMRNNLTFLEFFISRHGRDRIFNRSLPWR